MRVAIVCTLALLLLTGLALGNPIAVDLYATFDPYDYVHEWVGPPGATVPTYIVAEGWQVGGMTAISFKLSLTYGAVFLANFWTPSPIVTLEGSPESGYTVYLSECAESFPFVLAVADLMYLNPGQMEILPHPVLGNEIVDCSEPPEMAEYCYVQGVGLGMAAPNTVDLCGNAVTDHSWGAIKALYR